MFKSSEWYSENFLERLAVIREQDARRADAERKNAQFWRKNHLLPKISSQLDLELPYQKYSDVFGEHPAIGPELTKEQLEDIERHGNTIATLIKSKRNSELYSDKPNPKLIRIMGRTLLHRNLGYVVSAERFESPEPRIQPQGLLAGTVLLENGVLKNFSIGVNSRDVPLGAGLEFNLPEPVVEYKVSKSTSGLQSLTLEVGDRTYTEHMDNLVRFVDRFGLDKIA